MITLQLSHADALLVRDQLARRAEDMDRELVRTDAPAMQHELARDAERLRSILASFEEQVTPKPGAAPFGAESSRAARSPT